MGELSKVVNIGKVVEAQLHEVGIDTYEQLERKGSRQAWLDIKSIDPSACYNRLCGLEGAIQGVRWHSLSDETKKNLKDFYNTFK